MKGLLDSELNDLRIMQWIVGIVFAGAIIMAIVAGQSHARENVAPVCEEGNTK